MESVKNLTKNIVEAIHSSEEYLKYQTAKRFIDSDLESKNKIAQFKKLQFELGAKQNISNEEKMNLQNLYTELMLNENIDNYLTYEMILFKMVSNIYDEIVDSVDIDIDFI